MKVESTLKDGLKDHGDGRYSLSGHSDHNNIGRLLVNGQQQFIGHKEITINIAEADYANTAGLALLMEWSTWCQANDVNLVYEDPQAKFIEIVDVNNVEQILSFSQSTTPDLMRATGT